MFVAHCTVHCSVQRMNGGLVGWLARQARAAPSRKEEPQHRFSYFCDNPSSRLSLMLNPFAHKEEDKLHTGCIR